MTEQTVGDRIITIPNLISFVRLAAVPVFWWLVLGAENLGVAAIVLIAVSWTDWVDGYLARRLNQVTKLGKTLDPVADRLMIASAVIVGLISGIVPAIIGFPLIARELYMALVTVFVVSRGGGTLEVRYLGKAATFIVYGAVQSFYVVAVPFLELVFEPLAWISGVVGLILYWAVAIQYTGDARRAPIKLESGPASQEN